MYKHKMHEAHEQADGQSQNGWEGVYVDFFCECIPTSVRQKNIQVLFLGQKDICRGGFENP